MAYAARKVHPLRTQQPCINKVYGRAGGIEPCFMYSLTLCLIPVGLAVTALLWGATRAGGGHRALLCSLSRGVLQGPYIYRVETQSLRSLVPRAGLEQTDFVECLAQASATTVTFQTRHSFLHALLATYAVVILFCTI